MMVQSHLPALGKDLHSRYSTAHEILLSFLLFGGWSSVSFSALYFLTDTGNVTIVEYSI